MNFKHAGHRRQRQGRRVPAEEEQDRRHPRHGHGRSAPARSRSPAATARRRSLETKNIVIATGSDVARLPGIEIDEKRIVSSTGALSLDKVPGEAADRRRRRDRARARLGLAPARRARSPWSSFSTASCRAWTARWPSSSSASSKSRALPSSSAPRSPASTPRARRSRRRSSRPPAALRETLEADVVLVCIGRVPYTEGLGLKEAGVALDNRGRVQIDAHFATSVKGVYAIGDVVRGSDARAQGRGRRRRLRRDSRRASRACELRRYPGRGLHHAGSRLRRQDRGRAEGRPASPTPSANSPSPPMAAPRSTRPRTVS